ncbi:MAG: DEAD/DEAH box helicase [Bdellovibrionia bacterium]
MNQFKQFNLPTRIETALEALGFHSPTPIQAQAIPPALEGQDLIGCAQTGTGKTGAFCIPILTRLLSSTSQQTSLILVPTRELAFQIHEFWQKLTKTSSQIQSVVIIGGAAMQPQIRQLSRRPRLIIATPGRLVDHLKRKTVQLSDVAVLVLDEADRMLDMGFAPQLSEILKYLPHARQTLFFTATWASELDRLAQKYLKNPVRVTVGQVSRAAPQVSQAVVMTTVKGKNEALLDELNRRSGSVIVFARTKSRTDRVARYLSDYGVSTNRIHGGRSQGQRNSALASFRSGQTRVLVATDIAARGIDVANIAHVVNYDLPQLSDDYIHRIGRTGRAGATGQAVSLLTPEDRGQWNEITRLLKRTGSEIPTLAPAEGKDPSVRSSWQNPSQSARMAERKSQKEHPLWGDRTKQQKPNGIANACFKTVSKKSRRNGPNEVNRKKPEKNSLKAALTQI